MAAFKDPGKGLRKTYLDDLHVRDLSAREAREWAKQLESIVEKDPEGWVVPYLDRFARDAEGGKFDNFDADGWEEIGTDLQDQILDAMQEALGDMGKRMTARVKALKAASQASSGDGS